MNNEIDFLTNITNEELSGYSEWLDQVNYENEREGREEEFTFRLGEAHMSDFLMG